MQDSYNSSYQFIALSSSIAEVRGGVEQWLIDRWKARIKLPIRHSYGRPM